MGTLSIEEKVDRLWTIHTIGFFLIFIVLVFYLIKMV
jgi:hypothetical protein